MAVLTEDSVCHLDKELEELVLSINGHIIQECIMQHPLFHLNQIYN